MAALLFSVSAFAAPPGAIISNQAAVNYQNLANQPVTATSNIVELTTGVLRSPATVEFTRVVQGGAGAWQETVGPSACFQGGAFVLLADPQLIGGAVIDPTQAQDVSATSAYNLGEPAFIRLIDLDQNLDYQVIDTAVVTVTNSTSGDSETIQLSETGLDTGVFAGFIATGGGAVVAGDCVLQSASQSTLLVNYTDPADGADTAQSNAQFDPVQRVFESRTGTLVDGATIEIVYAATGLPAVVYGNDGVSQFPAAIVSGGSTVDSSGTSYVFGPGEYRFPVVPDGNYQLIVTPPPEYSAPSVVDPNDLQNLAGAPYLLGAGSFGAAFTKSGDISIAFDIPIDPRAEALFLQKQTLTTTAAPGDFVRYELVLENSSVSGIATNIQLIDELPPGVRFIPGSVTIDGNDAQDPVISSDLRTLEFDISPLNVSERTTVAYVVEIIGGKQNQEIVNRATAFAAGGLVSNEATAMIRLTEDLFRSSGTIIGRVLEADCSQDTFSEEQGVANIRVYLEDGRYAVTDAGGRFHFEGLKPGTHVAQLDTFTVPAYFDVIGCSDTSGFAGRADSQFVKLTQGSLLRADFYLQRKPAPEGRIDLELRSKSTDSADQVGYDMTINGIGNVAIENIDVKVQLPDGVSYVPGTMKIDGEHLGDPHVGYSMLSMALPDRRGNWTTIVEFVGNIESHISGELSTKAVAEFDSPIEAGQRTPSAETIMIREPSVFENAGYVLNLKFDVLSDKLSTEDMVKLDRLIKEWGGVQDIRISAVGHTDSQRIAPHNTHLFADNYVLSQARANSATAYIAAALGLDADNLQVSGRGPDEPIADNWSVAGRAKNRRVELVMSGNRPSRPSFLEVTKASSGTQAIDTKGLVPGMEIERDNDDDEGVDDEAEPSIESLQSGVAMLLPKRGFAPAIPAVKVSIQHKPSQSAAVWVNNIPVNPVNFDTTVFNTGQTVAVSRWKGVELSDGKNEIRVVVSDADGTNAKTLKRTIHYAGLPIRGEIDAERSSLIADGKTKPVIAVRLFDRTGKPSRRGMVGTFRIDAPYRSWWEVENDRTNDLVQIGSREPTYRIGADGIAFIELEPTTNTGEVTVHLKFDNYREQELRAWIKPAARDWILVGFAEGTAGYNTLSDNVAAAVAAGNEDEYYDDGRIAFFAKGQIRGEYLLTMAYDSDRERSESRSTFETLVDPNQYYPLYADTAEQRFEAPSQRKLYVKLERNQFFALFGDFETGLSVTDLSRYQRRFNGLQSEYRGENLGYTAFAADSSQMFNRDEIRGDGTSGLYQLSNAPIIANSDEIRIEVRDRFDTGQVLETTTMTRFLDYNLDALNGTLYFKTPVPSRDLNFNPIFIVAEYESMTTAAEEIVAGGRVSLSSSSDQVEVGATYVDDHTQGAESDLTGVDFRWRFSDQTLVTAEIAKTNTTVAGVEMSGSAHSVELEHNGENLDVRAYVREVEDEFGLGYQSAADQGVRRLGLDARAKVAERWFIEGEAGWQQILLTEDIRNLARAQVRYERDTFSTTFGVMHAEDKFDDGDSRISDFAELGLTKRVFDSRMTLRASGSTELSDDAESADYPTSMVFGADYRLTDGVDLVAEYEDAQGQDIDATMTRLGVRATPWARAQIATSLTNEITEFGPRLFANVGLVQGFQLNDRWLLDIGLDQTNTLTESGLRQFDPDRELASGSLSDDFLSLYTGAMYNAELWSANTRIEYRNSDTEERTSLLFGWYRQPTTGHGLSAGLTLFRAETDSGTDTTNADLKFGWAYRLANSEWSFLDRLDLIYDDLNGVSAQESSWRIINNFNANRRLSAATQMSLQYAFKYVRSDFGANEYTGYTDLIGFDVRRGLRTRWDIGANASIYHSYESSVYDYGAGLDVGYNIGTNIWLTLGYNLVGFHDEDFAVARYTAQGPFLRFSIKADQRTLKDIAGQR
ncbi:MAG: OmpA family protein [Gammaproteobacteria bacterium]|nr:OmpA family protein [Gammaproteobacteria bacterium]